MQGFLCHYCACFYRGLCKNGAIAAIFGAKTLSLPLLAECAEPLVFTALPAYGIRTGMNGNRNNISVWGGLRRADTETACMVLNFVIVVWFLLTRSKAVIANLHFFDMLSMVTINVYGSRYSDYLFYNLSSKLIWLPLILSIVCVVMTGCKSKVRAVALIAASVAVVALCDQVSGVIKRIVERPRPSHNDTISYLLHYVNEYRGGRFGFVSSHAANCFGESVWLMLLLRNRLVCASLFCFSIIVCYSRIYLGVHYPFDVLAGACLGNAIGVAVYVVCVRAMGREHCILRDRHNLVPAAAAFTFAAIAVISLFETFLPR